MKNIEDLYFEEILEDTKTLQKFNIKPVFPLFEGGYEKKLIEIMEIREKLFPITLDKGITCLDKNVFPLYSKDIDKNNISEGLIATYPIQPIICEIENKTGLQSNRFQCLGIDENSGIAEIVKITIFAVEETEEMLNTIKKIMENGGYFDGGKSKFQISVYTGHHYFFRPKFPKTTIKALPHYLYHITDAYSAEKIKKNGFYPCNKNSKKYKYPDRVHFFTVNNLKQMLQYAIIADKGIRVGKKEKRPIFTILQVDTTRIPDVTFYKDFDYDFESTEGIFTYSYISPTAISNEQTINLEKYNS